MKFEEVLTFIEEHKEDQDVSDWIAKLSGTDKPLEPAKVMEFIGTAEGRELIQPVVDQTVTKAIKTRDKVHEQMMDAEVKKRVAAEILKINPQEEPWQKEMREMKESLENEKKERANSDLKRAIVEEASRQGIDPFFIEDYMPQSFEVGKLFLNKIKDFSKKVEEKKANELMASGFKPGTGQEQSNSGGMTAKDFAKLSPQEQIALAESGEIDNITS